MEKLFLTYDLNYTAHNREAHAPRGKFSKFVEGENFVGMITDRSGDFDDQSTLLAL